MLLGNLIGEENIEDHFPFLRHKVPIGISISSDDHEVYDKVPFIQGVKTLINGEVKDYEGKVVNVTSPLIDLSTQKPFLISRVADMQEDDLTAVLDSARNAWQGGQGQWPLTSFEERILAIENAIESIRSHRDAIVNILSWEIAKTTTDACTEFDRTLLFIKETIKVLKQELSSSSSSSSTWQSIEGIIVKIRRAAIGIMLCLGPSNYPLNETYATLIPALLMGNIVIMKLPTVGGLAHILTMEAFAAHLPPGVIQFLSGSGRRLLPPLMASGAIDVLAFIGGSKAADQLIKAHPHPHRLKVFLQLEGKNMAIITPDAMEDDDRTKSLIQQLLLGTLSYNGQRCTALKLLAVHSSLITKLLPLLSKAVGDIPFGIPWSNDLQVTVATTSLPGQRVNYMKDLLQDAVRHGAKIINNCAFVEGCELGHEKRSEEGGMIYGNLMRPAIVYPVTPAMRLYHEEQFGPIIPILTYENTSEILTYFQNTDYGQQVSLFGNNVHYLSPLVDALSTAVGRININTQCGRSPDSVAFSGRRSSALGTMSTSEILRVFSIETVVAGKASIAGNEKLLSELDDYSTFLASTVLSKEKLINGQDL
eukprot:gene9925-10975_t